MDKTGTIAGYLGGLGIFAYLGLSIELTVIWFSLMIIDSILRYLGEVIHGKFDGDKAIIGIIKKLSILLMIFSIAGFLKAFNIATDYEIARQVVLGLFTLLLIMFEIHSIFNKAYYIRTGELITEKDLLSDFIKKLLDLIGEGIKIIEKKLFDKFNK